MTDALYTVEALSTGGGRDGHVATADQAVDLEMAPPAELGGSGEGYDPEQLFAAGYAACSPLGSPLVSPLGRTVGGGALMAKYLLLKHYRGAPEPPDWVPMNEWTPEEVSAHITYMNDFASRLAASGEFVEGLALSESGTWVRHDDEGARH